MLDLELKGIQLPDDPQHISRVCTFDVTVCAIPLSSDALRIRRC